MIKKKERLKFPVYEHLEYSLKNTYAQRLQWLEEANEFVQMLRRKKNYPDIKRKILEK